MVLRVSMVLFSIPEVSRDCMFMIMRQHWLRKRQTKKNYKV